MSHIEQLDFVSKVSANFPDAFLGRTLEIGSLDINGSIRKFFPNQVNYIGLDVGAGSGVDLVCQGQDYKAPDGSFDTVISCETMEHNPFWRETFANMIRVCRPGGMVLMTCASPGREEHGTKRTKPGDAPLVEWDYYKNLNGGHFKRAFRLNDDFSSWVFCTDDSHCDLFFVGFKAGGLPPEHAQAKLANIRAQYQRANFMNIKAVAKRLLVSLVGDHYYATGPVLPWKRKTYNARLTRHEPY